jgi:hypothetical protein
MMISPRACGVGVACGGRGSGFGGRTWKVSGEDMLGTANSGAGLEGRRWRHKAQCIVHDALRAGQEEAEWTARLNHG